MLGNVAESLEIGDLPIVPADMRAATIFAKMRSTIRKVKLRGRWQATPGSGWETLWRLVHINKTALIVQTMLAMASAGLFYGPAFFLQRLVKLMETRRDDLSWGYVYCAGLFGVNALMYLSESMAKFEVKGSLSLSLWPTLVYLDDGNTVSDEDTAKFDSLRQVLGQERCCYWSGRVRTLHTEHRR
jgi:hypothetical protein